MDKNFDLKIADFGLAAPLVGDGDGRYREAVGTPTFMAPEIIRQHPWQGRPADLFSCAVILFYLRSGHLPFKTLASGKDAYYQLLISEDSQ